MKSSKRWSASLSLLAVVLGVHAQAEENPDKLAQAKQSVRCAGFRIIGAGVSTDNRVREVVMADARRMSLHADALGAKKEMKDKWFAEFEQQLKDALPMDKSAKDKVRYEAFISREEEICQRLSGELIDALVEDATKAEKAKSTR